MNRLMAVRHEPVHQIEAFVIHGGDHAFLSRVGHSRSRRRPRPRSYLTANIKEEENDHGQGNEDVF